MDDAVRAYIEAISEANRALFDRVHGLILASFPEAEVVLSYGMPTYVVGRYRLYVAAWKHGLSIYGWDQGREAGFTARHPELVTHKGTIKLPPAAAAAIADEDLVALVRAALSD